MGTLGRTWDLTKQSFAVLRADKEILLLPVMSAIAAIVVSVSFFVPLALTGAFQAMESDKSNLTTYVVLFCFYYINYFVIIFFNSALVACANIRLSGGDPTVSDGLRMARQRIGRIAAWTFVAATVGLILRILESKRNKLQQLVLALIGTAWTLITYFIIPVIVFEDLSVFESVKRSTEIFRKNWGEQLTSGFSFGLLFFLLALPGILLGVLGVMVHPLAGVAVAVIYFLLLATVAAAVKGIFMVALYRYATQGEVPAGFSPQLVEGAFRPIG